jgi:hypothetical protein
MVTVRVDSSFIKENLDPIFVNPMRDKLDLSGSNLPRSLLSTAAIAIDVYPHTNDSTIIEYWTISKKKRN